MNSENTMSVAEARTQLKQMQDTLASTTRDTMAKREYRAYLEVQIDTYQKAITEFEAKEKTGD